MALTVELVPAGNWKVLDGDKVLRDDITTREEADAFVEGYEASKGGGRKAGRPMKDGRVDPDYLPPETAAAADRPNPQGLKSPTKSTEAGPDAVERPMKDNGVGDTAK